MTKGVPEDILNKCDPNTIPENFENTLYHYKKMGFIVIICASKIINIDDYNDSNSIDDYMCNLTFCGFITLKNKLKKEVINSIRELRQFGCNLIISTGDNVYNALSVGFQSKIINKKNIFSFEKDNNNRIIITKIYNIKKFNDIEEEKEEKSIKTTSNDKYSKQAKISNYINIKSKEDLLLSTKHKKKKYNDIYRNLNEENSENKELYYEEKKESNSPNRRRGNLNKNIKTSKNLLDCDKNTKNTINDNAPQMILNFSDTKNNKKEIEMRQYLKTNNFNYMNYNKNSRNDSILKKDNDKIKLEINGIQESSINKEIKSNNRININKSIEKYYYCPNIFEEYEDLTVNCIYCISGKVIEFLYKNKEKNQCKKLLEKIYKFAKIFFSMTSLDKSLIIDYYREYPDNCICTIGECQSDFDSIITSNVGINLKAPKNQNTILCHFYSTESSILSIKNIIREGRTINENILLLKISCGFYSMILNSYIICCLIRKTEVINKQLNFLELNFFIISISAFTVQYDNSKASNPLIQNKKLYNYHYLFQIVGIFIIKFMNIYQQCNYFIGNEQALTPKQVDQIFCSYYFIFCIEQLFSTVFLFNLIFFYRKNPFENTLFIIFNLLQLIYCVILITLNNSNFKWDFFNLTYFEFLEDLIDSFDDNNKINCIKYLTIDFFSSLIYSRIIYFIFYRLAQSKP